MASPGSSSSKLVENSDTAAFSPQPLGNQKALDLEDDIEFVEPLAKELQCPLCLEFLKEPTLTSCCGHHFCHECINSAIARSHVCPLCNEEGFQTLLNKEKQRLVNALKVYCKRKSEGCEWVGELGRLEHHLDVEEGDCGCVEVECEFGPVGCVAKLPRKDLQRHKEENVHKHLVLMSVMSLKSNEAFVKKLQEQQVELEELRQQQVELEGQLRQKQTEFQQQLIQKNEEIQSIRESLQQQVQCTQQLRCQLQQKDQQIADIQDQLLLRGKQIAAAQQSIEAKQQLITDLERQLKGEAEQLARVEVELTENAKQFVKVERKLQDKDQQLTMYERMNEKWLGDVERKQLEEKQEVSRRVADVDRKIEEAKIQFREGCNQTVVEISDIRKRIEQMETSLGDEQNQVNEKLEANEKRLDIFKRKQQEEKLEIGRRLAEVDKKVEEKGEELQEIWTQFQRGNDQMYDSLRRRIEQVETSLAEDQDQLKEGNEKAQKLEKQLVTFIPPFDFTMTDFEKLRKDDSSWYSPPFYSHIGGYKMCLKVCANGDQHKAKGTHVSLYVHLMRGEHDDHLKWPYRGDITVKVINQRKEEDHVKRTVRLDDTRSDLSSGRVIGRETAKRGAGIHEFIAHSALGYNSARNTEYLRNDCLKFQVTNVKVKNF